MAIMADEPILRLTIDVGAPVEVGAVAGRARRCIPLLSGTVDGRWRGRVVPGGADWQQAGSDGVLEIEARYALELETARGTGLVEVRSTGLRAAAPDVLDRLAAGEIVPPTDYYFRTAIRFYTGNADLAELNSLLAVAVGERLPGQVRLSIHPVL